MESIIMDVALIGAEARETFFSEILLNNGEFFFQTMQNYKRYMTDSAS